MKSARPVTIIAIAAVIFLIAAYFLSRGSAEADAPKDVATDSGEKKRRVVYPREQKKLRQVTRNPDDPRPAPERQKALDTLQRSLLSPDNKGVVFVEANALRHAPLMEKILRCRENEAADGLMQLKNELGIDPMEDLDRMGFDGNVFAASGFFEGLKIPPELGEGERYGDSARIWKTKGEDGDLTFARVGNDLMLTGDTEAEVKAAVDRAEGRAQSGTQMPPGVGESELYGEFGAEFIKNMVGASQDPTAQKIAELVTNSTVRMNVDEDAALSVDLQAVDEKSAQELSKAVGGAFAFLRGEAEKEDPELAQLLEQARVQPGEGNTFMVDVAVPGEFLLKTMGCDKDGKPVLGAKRAPK
jgi:hypothetical protein